MIARDHRQRGSALLVALFLLTTVAALGVFAVRMGVHQEQTTSVQLLKARAQYAARAGMEVWAYRVANAAATSAPPPACPAIPQTFTLGTHYGLRDYTVQMTACTRIASGAQAAYEVTFTARSSVGVFGNPGYVRQSVSRTISSIGNGSY